MPPLAKNALAECEEAGKIDEESKNNKTQVVQKEHIHV